MKTTKLTSLYVLFDLLSAMIAWAALFIFRKVDLEPDNIISSDQIVQDPNFWLGIAIVPAAWVAFYAICGAYRCVLRKSRLKEFEQTLTCTVIGVIVIFFALMLDDNLSSYHYYYLAFLFLLAAHFVLTYAARLILTTRTVKRVHRREIGFPTIMISGGPKAYQTYLDLENQEVYSGESFIGFLTIGNDTPTPLDSVMPCLGTLDNLQDVIRQYHPEEVILAVEDNQQQAFNSTLLTLGLCSDLIVKLTPDARDLIFGTVRQDNIFHSSLITLKSRPMEEWQHSIKRMGDILVSLIALILLSPLYLITAIIIKATSPGPIFYAQERIGIHGRPFKMHKFRSMYVDAEQAGPALSRDNDPRITPFGRFMRKVRLDEIPQFYNVLRGTMSLVGPRPERQYYIDQIVRRAPQYLLLQRVKPGITSWGQVRYGYASNVDEMVERLRYDLLYLENMSITTDIKILLYTVIIVFQGRGK
ncbi:MAG: sugar transferase [Bacteroidales bacterium]|nr:sugar transferase [Bacteroidales bacterium]